VIKVNSKSSYQALSYQHNSNTQEQKNPNGYSRYGPESFCTFRFTIAAVIIEIFQAAKQLCDEASKSDKRHPRDGTFNGPATKRFHGSLKGSKERMITKCYPLTYHLTKLPKP